MTQWTRSKTRLTMHCSGQPLPIVWIGLVVVLAIAMWLVIL